MIRTFYRHTHVRPHSNRPRQSASKSFPEIIDRREQVRRRLRINTRVRKAADNAAKSQETDGAMNISAEQTERYREAVIRIYETTTESPRSIVRRNRADAIELHERLTSEQL